MKFSKLLRGLLEENPGMSDLFISYKKLKKILKKLGHDEKADRVSTALPAGNGAGEGAAAPPAPVTSPPADGGGEEARAQEGPSSTHADDSSRPAPHLTQEEREFLVMLQEDVHRFNQYFMDKEEELVIRLQDIKDRLKSAASNNSSRVKVLQELVTFHGEAVQLLHWSALNFAGLSKILKKHDKISGIKFKDFYQLRALRMPFQSTEILTKLVRTAEAEVGRHLDTTGLGTAGAAAESGAERSGSLSAEGGEAAVAAARAQGAGSLSSGEEDEDLASSVGAALLPHEITQRTMSALKMWEALQHASTPSTVVPLMRRGSAGSADSEHSGSRGPGGDGSAEPPAKRIRQST